MLLTIRVRRTLRSVRRGLLGLALVATAATARAQQVDATVYVGSSLPFYDAAVTVRPTIPSIPGITVVPGGDLRVRASGGLVLGGSVAWQPGIFGIEGRVDTADLDIRTDGARFDLKAIGLIPVGSLTIGEGSWDLRRMVVLSLNARVRTPGKVSLIASGGFSYLPSLEVSGSVPLRVSALGVINLPAVNVGLGLVAAPGQSSSGLGGNIGGGIGIRLGPRTALLAEARLFGFRSFDLAFDSDDPGFSVEDLFGNGSLLQFNPAYFQASAGLIVSF